ncbi:T9SS type A sorting domain-containing protein [Segetibacter sp. 3557_3]|uniref:glucuronyl esterase domain-containing protein n=1 Tax=Segetibacter sp. 3557_3 TaxID=2547429 RepID=UPI00105865BE|nr:carbohydrate binding domain-containing protein [Segetibacter sp. 3557_3]TDH26799.1 T9SS type A sorting domain-containing protein [Segetibacter sp. 3557_3]
MKSKFTLATLLLGCICTGLSAQIPLVYGVENTGSSCAPPPLPHISQLPVIQPLPDPFMWSNGSGRSTRFTDWECRRNEIMKEIEHYEIGTKPPKPESVTASYTTGATGAPDTLRVVVTRNGQSLTLMSQVLRPAGNGRFPALIGMNTQSGSVPDSVFARRGIARIRFNANNVTTYGNPQITDPFFRLYPEYNLSNSGQYAAWSWGVSRIIDGLELVQAAFPVNMQRIGVTGCSYAGKMALFAGAFDERIALTIAQESGGGGAPSWRVSHEVEPNGTVEKIDNTDYRWFRDSMALFSGDNVYKLPHDHHELMAMIAPRALLVTANTDFTWLSNQAAYITARAARQIYDTLGIGDRFGFYVDGGHGHCQIPGTQIPAVQAFVDKFMAGISGVNTDSILVHPFPAVDYRRWTQWWGTGNPVLPPPPGRKIWLEAECATIGSSWNLVSDTAASNGRYVGVKSGRSSTATPPQGDSAYLTMPFSIDSAASYNLLTRIYAPAGEEYSYWMKLDTGAYQMVSSLLLPNGGFDNGLTGWATANAQGGATVTATMVADEVRTGTGAMKVVNPTAQPGNQWRVQVSSVAFPTTIGKQYQVSYWVKALNPGGSIRLSTGPTSAQYQGDQTIGTTWQQVTWTFTASITSTTFLFDMGQVANTYYIDDASVREVGGTGGWQWVTLRSVPLSVGNHTLAFGFREGNVQLDKVLITTFSTPVSGKGDNAANCLALPVNLVSYQATVTPAKAVRISWSTTSEIKNKQYRLERSTDGITYSTIATLAGNGNSSVRLHYAYTDLKPVEGINYYRLIQVDADGMERSLGIRSVTVSGRKAAIRVFPNPVRSELNIDLGRSDVRQQQITMYNAAGVVVLSKLMNVQNGLVRLKLDKQLGAGVYMLKAGGEQVQVVVQ